ncbi:EGF-like domain protein, partial [Ostertagia ostertagi]
IDECSAGTHDCDPNARCTDTDESYICTCNSGFLDKSPDQTKKPGRVCTQLRNECEEKSHNCSVNADCIRSSRWFPLQEFLPIYVTHTKWAVTKRASGHDEREDIPDVLSAKANQLCESGRHDCDKNAQCIERGANDYECVCKAGFSIAVHCPIG